MPQEDPKTKQAGAQPWPGRLARGILGGAIATCFVGLIDSSYARSTVAESGTAPSVGALLGHEIGVVAPICFAMAVAASVAALIGHPANPVSLGGSLRWFSPADEDKRKSRAILLPLLCLGSLAFTVATSHLGRYLLSSIEAPREAGAALAGASVALSVLLGAIVLAAYRAIDRHFRDQKASFLNATVSLPLSLLLVTALVAYGISTGTTGGEGGVFGVFGILKRAELDLRGPFLVALVAAVSYLSAWSLRKIPGPIALIVALIPLTFTLRAARGLDDDPRSSDTIERAAPLGKIALKLMRKATDRDHDGASAYFGGGDCNDKNPDISPTSIEIAGNGIDEDCSGADLAKRVAPTSTAAGTTPITPVEASKIPSDLNLILISVDTLRADLGFAGYPRKVTPTIDAIAAKGCVFENAYALASYTGKSIGPMMSGKYPSETNRGWSHYNKYPKDDIMVQERLKDAGIRTIGIHAHWYFKPVNGLGRGFDELDFSASPPGGIDATSDSSSSADRLSDAAISVLSKPENTQGRFFAWVHYFDPHAEYVKHKGTEEFGSGMRDRYDHEVRFTDDQVGRLVEFVGKQPWGKRTAIVITSDHGEAFGEHGMLRHGFEVWDELVHVPLVVYVPGIAPKRVKVRRSAVDLVPTILDLMSVKRGQARDEFDFLSGESLAADLVSAPGKEPAEREVLIDMPAGPFNEDRRAFISANMKLIISGGIRYQLFDLASDPGEKKDLADDKEKLKAIRGKYDLFRGKMREIRVKPVPK